MKIIIPLMTLLLFVGVCFTAQSENQANKDSNIPPQTISEFDGQISISELRHTKTSSDHQIYFLRNIHNNKFVWSFDPITVVDNDKIIIQQEEPSFSEIIHNIFCHIIMRYTFFLALVLGVITCLSIWLIPLIALRDFYRFINRRLKIIRA